MMYNIYWPVIQGQAKDNQKDRLSLGLEAQDQSINHLIIHSSSNESGDGQAECAKR